MESPILKQISKFLQDKKKYKRWLAVFVCLAVVVGFATTAALKMRGKAMTHDERVLNCKLQVHQHTDACYDQEKNIICGYADYVVHKHNDDCYDPHNGNLVCTLPEVEAHQHTDECYQEQQVLACGLEESEGHQHTEQCYTREQGELTCQLEEHTHTEECQAEDGTFTCGKEEHTHTDECYEWTETLTCGQEESEGHHHTEECNQVQKTLICQKPEIEVHTHGDQCYERVLITPEGEEIVQDPKDNTGVAEEVLAGTANKEVPEGRIEVRRICGKLQVEEHTHTQENGCIEIHEVVDGSDLRPADEAAENPADGTEGTPEGGNENLETAQTNWDGIEKSDLGEAEEQTIVKTFEGEGFKVIAEYKKDANIPEEAELRAEQITAESDEAHYAEREAATRESVGDENATVKALLKIGFYVGEQEVEPETPVSVTVQLLDENGLPEGAPITVVHFTEDGVAEKLEGSKAEDDATTFEVNKFCEFAITVTSENDTTNKVREGKWMDLDKKYSVKTDDFKYVFHIMGDIELPEGAVIPEDETSASEEGNEEDTTIPNEEGNGKEEGGETTTPPEGTDEEDTEESTEESSEEANPQDGTSVVGEGNTGNESMPSDKGAVVEEGEETTTPPEEQTSDSEGGETTTPSEDQTSDSEGAVAPEGQTSTSEGVEGDNADIDEGDSTVSGDNTQTGDVSGSGDTQQPEGVDKSDDVANDALKNDGAESGKIETGKKLKLVTEILDETSEEHKTGVDYAEKNASGEVTALQAISYTLVYEDKEIDLSDCKVTVTVAPLKKADQVSDNTEFSVEVVELLDTDGEKEAKLVTQGKGTVKFSSDSSNFVSYLNEIANPTFTVQYYAELDRAALYPAEQTKGTTITDSGWANWYTDLNGYATRRPIDYAYRMSIVNNHLPFIDTRARDGDGNIKENPDGTGGNLPRNDGKIPYTAILHVGSDGKIEMNKEQLVEVYSEKEYEYVKAPTIQYFNVLIDNLNYKLKELWVLKKGKNPDSENISDWDIYRGADVADGEKYIGEIASLHFTNREEVITEHPKDHFVLLEDDTVIRMVYKTTQGTRNNASVFYDYDISNGDHTTKDGKKIMNTKAAGINSVNNYPAGTNGYRYAFGNADTGVAYKDDTWEYESGKLIYPNKANKDKATINGKNKVGVYTGAAFGLVTGAEGEKLNFAIPAPNIFAGETPGGGKHQKVGNKDEKFSLDFSRNGDTYTLTGVKGVSTAQNLDTFSQPDAKNDFIRTNNFWPMDNENGNDFKFGNPTTNSKTGYNGTKEGTFSDSDDFKDHNSYFGLYYTIDFDLDKSYVGPLEYLFYGDDDMWVFLKRNQETENKLVCDIGGVHSSVGEIVNLWDWINRNDLCDHTDPGCHDAEGNLICKRNVYTLSFFYTERGASGSSCWMQFTLPSVSSMTPEKTQKDYGQLKVEKRVEVNKENYNFDLGQDIFTFDIKLKNRLDNYRYTTYEKDENGNVTVVPGGEGLVLFDGATFRLKHNQYIIVNYLPIGTEYEIVEQNKAQTVAGGRDSPNSYHTDVYLTTPVYANGQLTGEKKTEQVGTNLLDNKKAEGDIPQDGMDEVLYVNKFLVYELPKTGGEGTILYTMAGVAAVLLGAGFMYRKKFREGRVGGSS